MLATLITCLIIALIAWLCMWLLERAGLPGTPLLIARVIIAVIAIALILQRLGVLGGVAL